MKKSARRPNLTMGDVVRINRDVVEGTPGLMGVEGKIVGRSAPYWYIQGANKEAFGVTFQTPLRRDELTLVSRGTL